MEQSGHGHGDDHMDVDRSEEEDLDDDRSEEEDLDEDGTEEKDLDDDLIDGCHFLDIDIDNFRYPKIWIRAEYIRIYDDVKNLYEKGSLLNNILSAAVITGQPGIGESCYSFI